MKTNLSQPLSPHRQRKHDAMVQKILDTARAIMREQGVAALSIQELARRLDLRAPSLYHYFASKMEIYDALFRYGFNLYQGHVMKNNEGVQTWQEFVLRGFESYISFAQQNPELYQLCFERPVPGFVPSQESMQVSTGLLQRAYEQVKGYMNSINTDLTAQQVTDLVIAMMHGITALQMANEPEALVEEGRFGSLIPVMLELLEKSWAQPGYSLNDKE